MKEILIMVAVVAVLMFAMLATGYGTSKLIQRWDANEMWLIIPAAFLILLGVSCFIGVMMAGHERHEKDMAAIREAGK